MLLRNSLFLSRWTSTLKPIVVAENINYVPIKYTLLLFYRLKNAKEVFDYLFCFCFLWKVFHNSINCGLIKNAPAEQLCIELSMYAVQWILLQKKNVGLPQTMSKVQACMYCERSKFWFPASLSKLSSIMLVLSLKIGTNDCKIFKLNVGLRSLRIGFQNAPAYSNVK